MTKETRAETRGEGPARGDAEQKRELSHPSRDL